MTTEFTWNITQLEYAPQLENQTNVVVTAHWDCTGAQEKDGIVYRGRVYGATGFTYAPDQTFIPFDQLTKQQVLTWIWTKVDKAQIEQQIQNEIDQQITPAIVKYTPNW